MPESAVVTCPNCQSLNRVDTGLLHKCPVCGKCSTPLLPPEPLDLDGPAIERLLAKDELPVVVEFWNPSCGPCRMMAPALAQAAKALSPLVRIVKLNTEEAPEVADRHGIHSVPTMILFHCGREIQRVRGAMPSRDIEEWVRRQV